MSLYYKGNGGFVQMSIFKFQAKNLIYENKIFEPVFMTIYHFYVSLF